MKRLLTPEEYMQLPVRRSDDAHSANREEHVRRGMPRVTEWLWPLPESMTRASDELLVDMAALTTATDRMRGWGLHVWRLHLLI
ncbi:MAG: hypothetical protein M3Y49_01125 [Actinomycetota bacterium]|nr:hypothetical protein [Actinomycetota bacterium]